MDSTIIKDYFHTSYRNYIVLTDLTSHLKASIFNNLNFFAITITEIMKAMLINVKNVKYCLFNKDASYQYCIDCQSGYRVVMN